LQKSLFIVRPQHRHRAAALHKGASGHYLDVSK